MNLYFLEFDTSDDGEGTHGWEALASVTNERLPELLREIEGLLAWADAHFARGAIEDGGDWDYDLQCERQGAPLISLSLDPGCTTLRPQLTLAAGERVTLALAIAGSDAFARAFEPLLNR